VVTPPLTDQGVGVVPFTEVLDLATATDRAMGTLLAVVAQCER
jgi:DNA invertase Pin-like site-specific DNA recombinase